MSNQIGDRYTCSDPNCGCEIELKKPCNMTEIAGASEKEGDTERLTPRAIEDASTDGSSEELGSESDTALAEAEEETLTLTCFCGNEMRQSGSRSQSRSATASAD